MSKPFDLDLFNKVYARVEAEEVKRLMDLPENKGKSEDDVRGAFTLARVTGSNSYNKETKVDFKKKIKEAQELEEKKKQAPDNDVFRNLWGGVSGLAGAAGDALDAERKRVENAIEKHTQTGANQQQVTKTAAERTRLLGDAVARELREKRENQELERQPLLPLSRASSSSSQGSKSEKDLDSLSVGSQAPSQKSTIKVVKDLKNPKKRENQFTSPSPPPTSESESSSKKNKEAPTTNCFAGLKKAFLSCCSCLSNGSNSLKKESSENSNNTLYSKVPSEPPRRAEAPRQRREEPKKGFFESLRSGVKSLREKLPEYPEDIVLAAYQENKYTKRWGWRRMVEVPIPDAEQRGEIMSVVGRGANNLGGGLVTVGATTVGVVFAGAKYASGITLDDVTPGEKAKFAAGVAVGVVGAGFSAASAIRPPNLRAVRGALPSGSDVASALSSFRDSLPSRNDFRGMEINPPDVRKWANKIKGNTPSMENMRNFGRGAGELGKAIYQSGPTIPRGIPGGWLEGR